MNSFLKICEEWKKWSKIADKSEDGWQSSFLKWNDLIGIAKSHMTSSSIIESDLEMLEFCWSISEETEDLADFSKENIASCWGRLCTLANSSDKDVRWQIYSVFGRAGAKAEQKLREGLNDTDPYCRRRALLSLAKLKPNDAEIIGKRFMDDPDSYLRQASIEMIIVSTNSDFKNKAKEILLKDNVNHVAEAARKL